MQSSRAKIEGSYKVADPGNYVLVFDNTFSRTTPKILTFSVNLMEDTSPILPAPQQPHISGWLLKKKRRRMQGWAKRWFSLSSSGVLSYSIDKDSIIRGSIQVMASIVSNNESQRLIHIDSGTALYHLKTSSTEEHSSWVNALKVYDITANESKKSILNRSGITAVKASVPTKSIDDWIECGLKDSIRLSNEAYKMTSILQELKKQLDGKTNKADYSEELKMSIEKLMSQHKLVTNGIREQEEQWQSTQNTLHSLPATNPRNPLNLLNSSKASTVRSLVEHNEAGSSMGRIQRLLEESSKQSQLSLYSEEFFDAEDFVLSTEEDYLEAGEENDNISEGDSSDDEDGHDIVSLEQSFNLDNSGSCQRRSKLPSPSIADIGSALSVFRKNVGKDLSTIAMPVSMNEPINFLQKACEDMEYSDLLDKASTLSDSMERLMYVALFAISGYSSSQYRTERKPFNPMMTETYESIRPDKGFRFMSEKVSHNPLIIATHTESRNYTHWQCSKIKSKFWGRSMEFITEGTFHVTLTGHYDHFTYSKPSSWLRNMMAGEKYLEHAGEMKIVNQTTKEYAVISFKEGTGGGIFGAPTNRNDVIATFFDADNIKCRRVVGKWSEKLAEELEMNKRKLSVLWAASPQTIEDFEKYYGFNKFTVELNEITSIEDGRIPKTDTRLRPDQCLYEQGFVEQADIEKQRIEQKQRDRRKNMEANKIPWESRWFKLQQDAFVDPAFVDSPGTQDSIGHSWQFTGDYWAIRESGKWPSDIPDLW
ncbi:Oxysterol-binding protein-domain-containing protein [Phycomyces blakesleeanus]|uniref:Oxysterol-binding protein-domain-containing protein n=1 Tax=Phycomyces blakesleeanus TaxID=4837 RepID=A0ABR3BG73_PHYBL